MRQNRRRLFGELQAGPRASADPTAFAETLNLDHSVQQDGQEFTKLLLTLLERLFRESGVQVGSACSMHRAAAVVDVLRIEQPPSCCACC